jgi:hypothetical protein
MRREDVPYLVSRLMGNQPARWAPTERTLGDYDGRERTLEIFNAAPKDQLGLLAALRSERANLKEAAGGPILFIFHTEEESARLYAEFVDGFPHMIAEAPVRPLGTDARIDRPVEDGDVLPHRRAA